MKSLLHVFCPLLVLSSGFAFANNWVCEGICITPDYEFDRVQTIIKQARGRDTAAEAVRTECTGNTLGGSRQLFGSMSETRPSRNPGGGISERVFTPWNRVDFCYPAETFQTGPHWSCSAYCDLEHMEAIDSDGIKAFMKLQAACGSSKDLLSSVNLLYRFSRGLSEYSGISVTTASLKSCRPLTAPLE